MDEVDYEQMCWEQNYGQWLIETIASDIGIPLNDKNFKPLERSIDRMVYKGTDCGAWVKFDEKGIIVGTIVEGSDAEYSERIDLCECEEKLCKRFWAALENCEAFAQEQWALKEFE